MKKLQNVYCHDGNVEGVAPTGHETMEAQTEDLNGTRVHRAACNAKIADPHPAILNGLVLRCLASFLSVKELLECRRACKIWNTAVSLTLQTRSTYLKQNIQHIGELISPVQKTPKFPFAGYSLKLCDSIVELLVDEPMRNFLTNYSHVFKRVLFPEFCEGFGFTADILEFLSTYFSHIEVLDLSSMYPSIEKLMTSAEVDDLRSKLRNMSFPELKKLVLPVGVDRIEQSDEDEIQELVMGLINAAPHLREIQNFSPELTKAVTRSGKMNLVSTMNFQISVTNHPYCEVESTPPCQLSRLSLEFAPWQFDREFRCAILNAFIAVLTASRETLKSLTIRDLGSQLEWLPVFPKLNSLHIIGNAENCSDAYTLFPSDVSTIFPSLSTVKLQLEKYLNNQGVTARMTEPLEYFLWDKPLMSVTSLDINFAVDKIGFGFLGKRFPRVIQLSMDWETCFRKDGNQYRQENFWDVWTVPFRLRRMEIHGFNLWAHKDFSLDSFLTGIPESGCRLLRREINEKRRMDPLCKDALRVHPSMLYLKDSLRELVISIDYPPMTSKGAVVDACTQPNVSAVSVFYGLRLMESLVFYIAYDHRKFYSSNFKKVLAPIEEDNVILYHKEFPEPELSV